MSFIHKKNPEEKKARYDHLSLLKNDSNQEFFSLNPPGSLILLKNHPMDLPPFEVIHYNGNNCFIRQQSWGKYVQWQVDLKSIKPLRDFSYKV